MDDQINWYLKGEINKWKKIEDFAKQETTGILTFESFSFICENW